MRRPRRSATERIGESARTMKNSGPAFIGAAMRMSIGLRERRLAVLGAADPVRGHEAELDLARVQAVGVLDAGGVCGQHLDRRQRRLPVEAPP